MKLLTPTRKLSKAQTRVRRANVPPRSADLAESLARLEQKGLWTGAGESLSLRIPGREVFLFAPGSLLCNFQGERAEDGRTPPPAPAPVPEFAAIHAQIYRTRPDVGAVLWNRPLWGAALHAASAPMPTIFDEQARQMGPAVERLPADAFASEAGARALQSGANAFLFRDGVLLFGMTRERVIFNSELLEKCARAYLLALATGERVGRIPLYVRWIAHRRLLKDERRSAACYARGEIPTGFTAY